LLLSSCGFIQKKMPPEAAELYVQKFLADAGDPTDPVERLLVEQIILAHHNIARLYAKSASSELALDAERYASVAARLLAEFRRAVLALKTYRESCQAAPVTVVKQQNVAAGNQQIAYVEGKDATHLLGTKTAQHAELTNNPMEQIRYESPTQSPGEPTTSGSREAEYPEIQGPHRRRSRTKAAGDAS
jgi:hypothetical protein